MFENPRRGRQARNFTTNVPKIADRKSSSEQMFSENCRWVPLMWMGFSDEIEVAMIAINKATILEITGDDRIAIPMTFGNIRRAIARSDFLFCLAFLIFAFPSALSSSSWLVKLAYSVITQDNSWYATIYFVENNADLMENARRKRRSQVPFSP